MRQASTIFRAQFRPKRDNKLIGGGAFKRADLREKDL